MMDGLVLASGAEIDLNALTPELLGVDDVAEHLSRQPFRSGLTREPIWLAQVAAMLCCLAGGAARHRFAAQQLRHDQRRPIEHERAELLGLLHYEPAAFIGDPPPMLLSTAWITYQTRIRLARRARWGLWLGPEHAVTALLTGCASALEATLLAQLGELEPENHELLLPIDIRPMPREMARRVYLWSVLQLTCHHRGDTPGWSADRDSARNRLAELGVPPVDCWGHSIQPIHSQHRASLEALEVWLSRQPVAERAS